MRKYHLQILIFGLVFVGFGLFLYKHLTLNFPLVPDSSSTLWNVEAKVSFRAKNSAVKVALFIPQTSRRSAVLDENFVSRGYGLNTQTDSGNRKAVWSIRQARDQQNLYYRAIVRQLEILEPQTFSRAPALEDSEFEASYFVAAEGIIAEVRQHSADIPSFVAELLRRLNDPNPEENVELLLPKKNKNLFKTSDVAARILNQALIPARIVHGIRLQERASEAPLINWLEVFDKDRWLTFDVATGRESVPEDYFPWWRGKKSIVEGVGIDRLTVSLAVSRDEEAAISTAMVQGQMRIPRLLEFSLFSLPIQTQSLYRVLLLIPLGAFVLVLLRNVIGITTFGTFMPVLIALAFRETQLLWGLILFSFIVSLGLLVRFYVGRLKLLLVPRLATVLIVVVIIMAMMSILTHKLGLDLGLSLALFPMVIMTMTIERMCIAWEESGAAGAIKQGLGSLAAAALVYIIMTHPYLEHLLFVFPELLLVVLACTLALGRYTGYRLLELKRFKSLVQDAK